jgi:hypothetical protein
MAKATGYFCDACKKFDTTNDTNPPIGWLRLSVRVDGQNPNDGFDLCSNKCLVALARERVKAERETTPTPRGGTSSAARSADDGLTRVSGAIDVYLRATDASDEPWCATYAAVTQSKMGTGYTWSCAFDASEVAEFDAYLSFLVQEIYEQSEPQTTEQKRFLDAVQRRTGVRGVA